jgi:hypothetical protein
MDTQILAMLSSVGETISSLLALPEKAVEGRVGKCKALAFWY